jgi:two-component system phosphate regulon sensor histidine kinase PhoR
VNVRTPKQVALASALFVVLPLATVYFILAYFLERDFEIELLLLFIALGMSITYFVVYTFIERFLYSKVKVIYKTIHSFKTQSEKKGLEMSTDILGEVNKDVAHWAEEKIGEIKDLQNADTFRKEFVGNLAHELKTPIFNIQGYLDTLAENDDMDSELRKKFLERAISSCERLEHLVSDLDEISRLESGAVPLKIVRFDILQLAHDVCDSLEKFAEEKNVTLFVKNGPFNELWVEADRNKIEQVLINLIVNSLNYGVEGGETRIRFYDMNDNVLIEVADNGIGIAKEHLARLFERFYRVDKSRSRHEGGSGLGLAICKHIIENHQQTLTVRSTEEVGSTFGFTIKKSN